MRRCGRWSRRSADRREPRNVGRLSRGDGGIVGQARSRHSRRCVARRADDLSAAGLVAPTIRCLLFRPTSPAQLASAPALLHVHGGGFATGMPEMDLARNIELARATGCAILSVDYRLAPEHPHPAGLEDCHAALVWLAAQAKTLGIDPDRIGIIGESAGGGLAAALALVARDRRSVALACQVLVYPMLILARAVDGCRRARSAHGSLHLDSRVERLLLVRLSVRCARGTGDDRRSRTEPCWAAADLLAVGELDLFVHDNLAYVNRLLAARCSVEAHLYPGAIHGFDRMVDAPASQRYTRELVDFVLRHLG